VGRDYLTGLVNLDNRLLILLNIDNMFGEEESDAMTSAMDY
jgi:chemotaxis signal transduction protein